jgi:hypothetical protein
MSNKITILCGSCKSPVEAPPDLDQHFEIVCSGCGQTDRFDYVLRTVTQYVTDRAAKGVSDAFTQGTRGNSFVKFEAKRSPDPSFRWIAQ